jgi:uncharacterized metal-binding protein
MPTKYKLLMFTCYGGCATGVAASKALIRIWSENPTNVKIGCLPALAVPAKFKNILKISEKRILIDACKIKCGKKFFDREKMPLDLYIELSSALGVKKKKAIPTEAFEQQVYLLIQKKIEDLLN